uniref:PIPK domain-containing protein n=1 Tax=Zea mays TaxID=4577 RepID=C4J7R8_MAIZE|nr:unknown [Zea mays]
MDYSLLVGIHFKDRCKAAMVTMVVTDCIWSIKFLLWGSGYLPVS